MEEVKNHFKKVDSKLYALIQSDDWYHAKRKNFTKFEGLCRIVAGQQLSTKAAHSIYQKFIALFPSKKPTPEYVLTLSDVELRSSGLSTSKCRTIRELAEAITHNRLPLSNLSRLSEERIYEHLIQIPGIGPWSVEMFLMFHLGREDMFSGGDLGLRTAIMKLDNKRALPTPEQAMKRAEVWSPYRTYACRILWNSLDNNPT